MLSIRNLHITVGDREVVKGVSLDIPPGEIHALMGPNGSGKTSLAMGLVGHPKYAIAKEEGNGRATSISLDGIDITQKTPDERARMGLFMAHQNPIGVDGVTVEQLLRVSVRELSEGSTQASRERLGRTFVDVLKFRKHLEKLAQNVGIKPEMLYRSINVGFSGGEKKRLEVLQLLALQPKYAILDETDSGLDIDALKQISSLVKSAQWPGNQRSGILVITHYARLLKFLEPDRVHIMVKGKIVKSGRKDLAEEIEKKGYGGRIANR